MEEVAKRFFELADKVYPEQQDFAKAIGVSASIVSQWRMGINTSYNRKGRLAKIAAALGVTIGELHGEPPTEPASEQTGTAKPIYIALDTSASTNPDIPPIKMVSEPDFKFLQWFRSMPKEKQKAFLIAFGAPKDIE